MRFKMSLMAGLAVLALTLAAACGNNGDRSPEPSPTPEGPPVASGSVAPNVFMTFQGQRYRAVDVGTDLVSRDQVEVAGATEEIDIDHAGPVDVFRLTDESADRLYTFQPGRSLPEEEGGSIPDVWLEWAPADEPGSVTTLPPDEPVAATPVPGAGTQPGVSVPVESVTVDAARAHLAQRLRTTLDAVEVVSVEAVDWPNACLGAAQPGEACAEVITSGFRVVLAVDGVEYEYHTDTGSHVRPVP